MVLTSIFIRKSANISALCAEEHRQTLLLQPVTSPVYILYCFLPRLAASLVFVLLYNLLSIICRLSCGLLYLYLHSEI